MHRISLSNTEFEGKNNAYLLDDGNEIILIDTGLFSPKIHLEFQQELSNYGCSISDIDIILLTHWHADHVGLAGTIQEESGAKVYCHAKDSPLVQKDPSALHELLNLAEKRFEEWSIPPSKLDPLIDVLKLGHKLGGPPPHTTNFDDGDQIESENYTFSVFHLPGHTLGLSCFIPTETNLAFVGDAVLPVYTPNIGGADLRVTSSLSQYRDGLLRLRNQNLDVFYPGHRHEILTPTTRINEILQHHRDRLEQIISLLTNPTDIWDLSTRIFGPLDGIHTLYGSGEIFAHLEYLESMKIVDSSDGLYSLTSPNPDVHSIF